MCSVIAGLLKSRARGREDKKQKAVPAQFYSTVFTVKGRRKRASLLQLCDWLKQPLGADLSLWGRERGRGRNARGWRERKKGWCGRERKRKSWKGGVGALMISPPAVGHGERGTVAEKWMAVEMKGVEKDRWGCVGARERLSYGPNETKGI